MPQDNKVSFATMEDLDNRFFVGNPKAIRAFFNVAVEEYLKDGDKAALADALALVVKWSGASNLARKTKLSRQSIYNATKPTTSPSFTTVVNMLHAAGFRLTLR